MSNINDLSDTIKPKSDQLNADDLITGKKTITVNKVKRGGNDDPIIIGYDGDDGRPYKPCKSMRRVLIAAWGKDGSQWIGRSMTLYCDPSVTWAGKEIGGIRISHLSDIERPAKLMLTTARGRRSEYVIEVLQKQEKPPYPDDKFNKAFPAMKAKIESGEWTTEQVITKCEQTGRLTAEQRKKIRECGGEPDNTKAQQSQTQADSVAKSGKPQQQKAQESNENPDDLFDSED